jgi:hypothetical protein
LIEASCTTPRKISFWNCLPCKRKKEVHVPSSSDLCELLELTTSAIQYRQMLRTGVIGAKSCYCCTTESKQVCRHLLELEADTLVVRCWRTQGMHELARSEAMEALEARGVVVGAKLPACIKVCNECSRDCCRALLSALRREANS